MRWKGRPACIFPAFAGGRAFRGRIPCRVLERLGAFAPGAAAW
jgi:hypothetical protein